MFAVVSRQIQKPCVRSHINVWRSLY